MANFVTNRITLIGNSAIKELAKEINRRFNADSELSKNYSDTSQVGRLLYGLSGEEVYLSKALNAKWVYPDLPLDEEEPFRLISGWRPVFEIQSHILKYASTLDPNVIVYMEYDDESPNFVGISYITLENDTIIEFDIETDLTNCLVAFENDYEEELARNQKTLEYERVLTWEQVWDLMNENRKEAFEALKAIYSWVQDSMF